jgi:ribosome-associated protein
MSLDTSISPLVDSIVEIIESRKGEGLSVYSVGDTSTLTDYVILCTCTSAPHIRAVTNAISHDLKAEHRLAKIQGAPDSGWVIMDYGEAVVHILHPETREYYQLEELQPPSSLVYSVPVEDEFV